MAVRIRVYPQNGMAGAAGMYGGAVSAQTYYTQKLQTQQQVSNLRLGYERALFNEKLDKVRLEERLKNPYLAQGLAGGLGGMALGGLNGLGLANQLGAMSALGGMNMLGSMLPLAMGAGSGQTNVTNQSSPGTGSQSVTNSNSYNNSSQFPMQQFPMMPQFPMIQQQLPLQQFPVQQLPIQLQGIPGKFV